MLNKLHSKKPALLASLACGASLLLASNTLFADRIAAGDTHNLAADGNGNQYVWGGNANGQLGDGTTLDALNPIAVVDIRYQAQGGAIAVVSHYTVGLRASAPTYGVIVRITLLGFVPQRQPTV